MNYNDYSRLYPPEIFGDAFFIDIPLSANNDSLKDNYINPLIKEGYNLSIDYNYNSLYLIKPF